MPIPIIRRRIVGRLLLVLVAVVGLMSTASAAQAVSCKVKGTFSLTQVTGAACLSPVAFCATGTYTGDLAGSSTFTGSTLIQTVDTPTTAVILVTGDNVIETKGGGFLSTKDAIVLRTTGSGDFAEVDTVVAGAGRWAGAVGVIRAEGTFVNGSGAGDYVGEVCGP
jgi:hypothetical protein